MKRASLVLAALLQVLPICRVAVLTQTAAPSSLAIVFTWLAGAVALLGGFDAVSGASAGISGLVKYNGTTPVGSPTNYVVEPIEQIFKYRITVNNPGTDFALNYFNCVPLPPGLTINTNLGAAGYITGTPTTIGTYSVTLIAGNLNYPTPATLPATIVIFPANAPPVISTQPQSQSVLAGSNATFSVTAGGSLPLAYQWTRNNAVLAGKTSPALTLTNLTSSHAGDYRVIVTNSFGSVTSTVARLTVREPFLIELRMGQPVLNNNVFGFQVTGPIYTNYVIWRSTDLGGWAPIRTNWVIDGYLEFSEPAGPGEPRRFYRVSIGP